MTIKNLDKAASRIKRAIKEGEKIILYGDSDLDGATSVIILKESIKNLGGKISAVYFPDREIEGYGITKTALERLKKFSPALLISLDCGIGNIEEIKIANTMGFSVIVIDHHKVLDKIPEAEIVVDPKQEGDEYPFKELCAGGLSFKLAQALLQEKMTESLRGNFIELAALATIADMMPQIEDNKELIDEGLERLEVSLRPGIRAFFDSDFFSEITFKGKVNRMISVLNARDVKDAKPASFRLLSSISLAEAKRMIPELHAKNKARKERVRQMVDYIKDRIKNSDEPIIFEGEDYWDFTAISTAASILCNELKKPTFIYKKLAKESQGTVRVPSGMDSVILMGYCKEHVITYGGHPLASGFRIKNENLDKFKGCLIKNLIQT